MPANLPPDYYELEREFRAEKDPREKLRLAQELLALMPKHKGTDKLQADMKAKISKLKKLIAGGEKKHGARAATTYDYIPREGAGQIVLIGPPNSGKSSLVDSLTNARPLVADYPYTTRAPLTAMMTFETVQLQLIDTPPISAEQYEPYMSNLIRNADLVVLVCDVADPAVVDVAMPVIKRLEEKRIILKPEFESQPEDPRYCIKKAILVAHKAYDDESGAGQAKLAGAFPGFNVFPTSVLDDDSLAAFQRGMFDALNIIRVYTKQVGKEVELVDPVIIPVGGTVEEAAAEIHKDFALKLRYAKIWGRHTFDGQRVQRDYALHDGDVVEFHI